MYVSKYKNIIPICIYLVPNYKNIKVKCVCKSSKSTVLL